LEEEEDETSEEDDDESESEGDEDDVETETRQLLTAEELRQRIDDGEDLADSDFLPHHHHRQKSVCASCSQVVKASEPSIKLCAIHRLCFACAVTLIHSRSLDNRHVDVCPFHVVVVDNKEQKQHGETKSPRTRRNRAVVQAVAPALKVSRRASISFLRRFLDELPAQPMLLSSVHGIPKHITRSILLQLASRLEQEEEQDGSSNKQSREEEEGKLPDGPQVMEWLKTNIEKQLEEKTIMACPGTLKTKDEIKTPCAYPMSKGGECNQITCPRCNLLVCFFCGAGVPRSNNHTSNNHWNYDVKSYRRNLRGGSDVTDEDRLVVGRCPLYLYYHYATDYQIKAILDREQQQVGAAVLANLTEDLDSVAMLQAHQEHKRLEVLPPRATATT
jgi:hypothetical protein